jgi:hypothetical protein
LHHLDFRRRNIVDMRSALIEPGNDRLGYIEASDTETAATGLLSQWQADIAKPDDDQRPTH